MSQLKEKLAKAELALTEAKEQAANLKESEHNIKTRLNKLQQEYDSHKKSCEKQISELQVSATLIHMSVFVYMSACVYTSNTDSQ